MEKSFELSPFYRYVANKLVNCNKYNIVWYVDDDKLSHMVVEEVEKLVNDLKNRFGELVVTRRNKHTFLGMNVNIMEDQKVELEMKDQFLEAIKAFGENID